MNRRSLLTSMLAVLAPSRTYVNGNCPVCGTKGAESQTFAEWDRSRQYNPSISVGEQKLFMQVCPTCRCIFATC